MLTIEIPQAGLDGKPDDAGRPAQPHQKNVFSSKFDVLLYVIPAKPDNAGPFC
jgi:hypothetical protein